MPDPGRIPGAVIIPSVFQVRLGWTLGNTKLVHNVMHVQVSDGFTITPADLDALLASMTSGGLFTAVSAFMSTQISVTSLDVRDIRTANNALIESGTIAVTGADGTDPLPPEVAFVLTLRTLFAGQGFRGRIYLPGWSTNALDTGGFAKAAMASAAVDWVNDWKALFLGNGMTLCVAQPARQAYVGETGVSHPARDAASFRVEDIVARDLVFDSQRRRSST